MSSPIGRPEVLLTFTLPDGTTRSKVCDHIEALEQLEQAQKIPGTWMDFTITDAPGIPIHDANLKEK